MNNQEDTREFCDKVNGVTTVLAVIELMGKKRIICSYASYDRETRNATVWFYNRQLSKIFERTEKPDSRDPSYVVEGTSLGTT